MKEIELADLANVAGGLNTHVDAGACIAVTSIGGIVGGGVGAAVGALTRVPYLGRIGAAAGAFAFNHMSPACP